MRTPDAAGATDADRVTRAQVIGKLAHAIEHQLPTGDVAELRRISPDQPYTPALWKLLLSYVPESWVAGADRDCKEARWAAVLMGMAFTAGLHQPGLPLGQALANAGWSELRFVRLLRERGDALTGEVRRVAQYLASKSQSANWADVAALVLDQEGDWAEKNRRRIARSYYRALYKKTEQSDA